MRTDTKKLIFGATVTVVALLLTFMISDFRLYQLASVAYWSIAMLGLNLLTGFNGQISIGHGTFMAIGGYGVAITVERWGLSYPLAFVLAFVVCFVVGGILGIPALRLPGISLALITLAMSLAFPQVLKKFGSLTGGVQGISTPPARQFNSPWPDVFTNDQFRYLVVMLVCAFSFWLVFNLVRGRWGLAMMSVRDNPISAASMGVNLSRTKVTTFAVSAGLAGLGGALQAMMVGFMSPESFTIVVSIQLLTGIVIGGMATVFGAVLGGFFQVYMLNFANQISDAAPGAIYGVIIILVMILAPGGIIGLARALMIKLRSGASSDGDSSPDTAVSADLQPAGAG